MDSASLLAAPGLAPREAWQLWQLEVGELASPLDAAALWVDARPVLERLAPADRRAAWELLGRRLGVLLRRPAYPNRAGEVAPWCPGRVLRRMVVREMARREDGLDDVDELPTIFSGGWSP